MGSLQWGWVQGEQRWHKALALRHTYKQGALTWLKYPRSSESSDRDPRTRTEFRPHVTLSASKASHQPVWLRGAWGKQIGSRNRSRFPAPGAVSVGWSQQRQGESSGRRGGTALLLRHMWLDLKSY